ncbi:uncharacterized protein LOC134774396 [Penaeus indicus]|uniref:uncharacterized protein LOC134774396 n=1 Tax=Penaeus indicus TaxID=29960 RepID=UPI00300C5222
MGASATKADEGGQHCNNNTAKEKAPKLRGKGKGSGNLPSSATSSPATHKKQEAEESEEGKERNKDKERTKQGEENAEGQEGQAEGDDEEYPAPPDLTEKQKTIIKESWKALEANVARVGVVLFIKLFETHPDVQEVFMPFKGVDLEEIKHSKQLRAHALRVMGFVNKAVARLDRPDKLVPLVQECGKSHFYYGANIKYIDYVGPQFITSIRPSMEEENQWSPELEEAWVLLFQHIAYLMKSSMKKEMHQ